MKFIAIFLLGITSCAQGPQDSISNTYRIKNDDNQFPFVIQVIPTINNITINFSTSIKESSVTVNSTNTECKETIQISSDNFITCITLDPVILFNQNKKKVQIKTTEPLENETNYSIKITTQLTATNEKKSIKDYRSEFITSSL